MTADIGRDIGRETGRSGLTRGMGFGRGGGQDSLAERREAAQRRLSSSVRAAELVECGLRRFDEALAEYGADDHDGSLRPTVRALLGIAYSTVDYDVMLVPASRGVAVRIRHTPFGPEAELLEPAAGGQQPPVQEPTALPPGARPADEGAAARVTEPASPWWTDEARSG
jgi:hypothetical protein